MAFDPGDTYEVAKKLENLGWLVSVSKNLDAIRIVVMPHITKDHVKNLLKIWRMLFDNKHTCKEKRHQKIKSW